MLKYTLAVLFLFFVVAAEAVIVAGGDGTQNTTAPAGGQGWDYVGRITSANGAPSSVTYISNNWFVTGYHVQALDDPTGVLLGGSAYSIDAGSWTRLQNSVGGDADLAMFRVNENVGLSALSIRSTHLPNNSLLTMIGNGRNRQTGETYWDASWNETTAPGTYSGYKWASGATKRWGTNNKELAEGRINSGYGITDVFYTGFDDVGGNEAQGATYDSGGGVFHDTGSEWELAGVMVTVGTETGQPWPGTSVYGNETYIANMQHYADQITTTAAIPEPSVLALGVVFPLAAFFLRRIFLI